MNYKNKYYKYKLKYLLAKKKLVGGNKNTDTNFGGSQSPQSVSSLPPVSNEIPQENEWYVPETPPRRQQGYVPETPLSRQDEGSTDEKTDEGSPPKSVEKPKKNDTE